MYIVVSLTEDKPRDTAEKLFDLFRVSESKRNLIREFFGKREESLLTHVVSTHSDPVSAVENVIDILPEV
jgi:hypothetical protein